MASKQEAGKDTPWTKVGVIAGVLSLILTYIGLAISNNWPCFRGVLK